MDASDDACECRAGGNRHRTVLSVDGIRHGHREPIAVVVRGGNRLIEAPQHGRAGRNEIGGHWTDGTDVARFGTNGRPTGARDERAESGDARRYENFVKHCSSKTCLLYTSPSPR